VGDINGLEHGCHEGGWVGRKIRAGVALVANKITGRRVGKDIIEPGREDVNDIAAV
jgi:hypothetical protein